MLAKFDTTTSIVVIHTIWDKVSKSGPSKICGRQPLKHLKGYGVFKETIFLQIF